MNKIIIVSLELGSGGRELGRRLSEQLNVTYYDQEILSEISNRTELAEKSECVIVGRCADYILKGYQPLRIFVYADMESKIIRCRQKTPSDELLADKELNHQIALIDKK